MSTTNEKLNLVKSAIKTFQNFPKDGIIFRDIFGVFEDVTALKAMKDLILEHASSLQFDTIAALDSRGFLIGPIISAELGVPFVPIRKAGKLPGDVIQQHYTLEYGETTMEIQNESICKGTRVLIVDDLLATGGSMAAAIQLLQKVGAQIVECFVIIELCSLNGRSKLDVPVYSLIQYD